MKRIPLDDIDAEVLCTRADDRKRAQDNIECYRHAYERGDAMPPLAVYQCPDHGWVLVDGWHRYYALVAAREAKRNVGEATIRYDEAQCEIVGEGTVEDAHRYALEQTNQRHGLRLSDGDKQERARQALVHGLYGDASNRKIADRLGVSHTLVGQVRHNLEAEGELAPSDTRESQDGRHVPTDSGQRGGGRRREGAVESSFQCAEGPPTAANDQTPDHGEDSSRSDGDGTTEGGGDAEGDSSGSAEVAAGSELPAFTQTLEQLTAEVRQLRLRAQRAQREHPEVGPVVNNALRSLRNAEITFRYRTPVTCPWCDGTGCGQCHGRGYVQYSTARSAEQTRKRTGYLPGTGGSAA